MEKLNTHTDKAIAAAAEVLAPEVVETASVGSWSGQWGAMAWAQAIPLVGMYLRQQGKKRAGGLPQRFIVALTPDRLVVLSQPKAQLKGWEIVAKEVIRSYPRAGIKAEVTEGAMGSVARVTPAEGEPFEVVILDATAARAIKAALA